MKYNMLHSFSVVKAINNEFFLKNIIYRKASAGLGLWDERHLTVEMKHSIEKYWKDKIQLNNKKVSDEAKEKFYVLSMFPYPSGMLHMGHVRVYTISDSIARFYRMKGKEVIHPMGWDAFGLPAENAAIEKQVEPLKWTEENIQTMKNQLETLGCSFDWHRELATCDPNYYKWTQYLFLRLYERGLVYQKEAFVNWDPVDQTVLADEQVDENNRSWRSGAVVEKKLLKQWFIRTTAFAESLLNGLSDPMLKEWRDIIKIQQHWIGECNGTNFDFKLETENKNYPITMNVWIEKPELIEHVKFVTISKNNMLSKLENITEDNVKLNATVINPFTNEELPIFVTDSIEYPEGRDNHLGVPCVSETDAEFCNTMGIPFENNFSESETKRSEILEKAKKWQIGGYKVSAKLQDWLISRQRYWGTPIPVIHCEKCGTQPVPLDQLPVKLPKVDNLLSSMKGFSLKDAKEWYETSCPTCGGNATREVDTMDTFVDSSWYFLRYLDPKNDEEIFSKELAMKNLPVDLYIGGKEHAVLHLYYARFMNHFLHSEGLVPTKEPFKQLLVQGIVKGLSYRVKDSGKYLRKEEVEKIDDKKYVEKSTGKSVSTTWEKMSKSKFNGVDPLEMFETYSKDTTRLLILADVAPTSHRKWSDETITGIDNFQYRVWMSVNKFRDCRKSLSLEELMDTPKNEKFIKDDAYMFDSRNYFLKSVTFNIVDSQQLSVAISRMQGLTNSLRKVSVTCVAKSREYERALAAQIIMLAPLAPHFASELWSGFCSVPHHLVNNNEFQWDKDVLEQEWPEVDMEYKLSVKISLNGTEFLVMKTPRYILDNVRGKDDALELLMKEPKFEERLGSWRVVDVRLRLKEGCDGAIDVTSAKITDELSSGNVVQ